MKRTLICIIVLSFFLTNVAINQIVSLNSNQALPLIVNAGFDVTVISGSSVIIGDSPTALQGYGNFIYMWSPPNGLDDPTAANPIASPTETITYIVTVTDAKNCAVQDEVTVTVKSNGIDGSLDNVRLSVYPNPTNGLLLFDVEGFSGTLIVKLINSIGNVVHQSQCDVVQFYREELDTRRFSKGNYFVVMNYGGKVVTKAIMIQ